MFMGVLCYVAATYVIFLLDSTALQIVLGVSALGLSIFLIAAGFSSSNTKQHIKQRSYSDAVRSTRAHSLVSSAGALNRKSNHD